ncbi:hypothetical protein CCO03_06900 [Comamonas serinivorans]|uniref:IPTL-CTERM protein sorting domain-containing protein n=1 Tax=Comamonas serinivorans TaxID=1082851 RepID=A0A1Y0EM08_9BURK|nr:hypothetical protein CCO03_06900 [Comamonas serinivorans]
MLAALGGQASELKLYLSQPAFNAALNAAVPDGALPWPASYGESYVIETFNGEALGTKTSGTWAVGRYAVAAGGNTNVSGPSQWGGAGTGTRLYAGGSPFLNAGNTGTPAGVTITLDEGARYVGFWWSAGSDGNHVELLDEHDNVLVSMNTSDLMNFLGSAATFRTLDGATYNRGQYNNNPFTSGGGGQPFAYLNFVLNDSTGTGSVTIRKLRFWGTGFELDNVAVRSPALTGTLPPSWIDTGITKAIVDPPVTEDDTGTTRVDQPVTLNLVGNDPYVPPGSTVTVPPRSDQGGTVTAGANPGEWRYTPPPGFTGTDTFSYEVCLAAPNQTTCATSTVTVTVVAPDVRVDLTGLPPAATVGQPYTGSFSCTNQGTADALAATTCKVDNLPQGVTPGACAISPGNVAWVAGDPIPVGETVTCAVSGTPDNQKGTVTVQGSTSATGDTVPGNNTATQDITVSGVPDVVVDMSGLPNGTVGQPYEGQFTCTNRGTADAPATTCDASLAPWMTQGACTISPAGAAWTSPATIPEGATVTCPVTGTPKETGEWPVTGTGGGSTGKVDVSVRALKPVPTLTHWGQLLMAGALAALGLALRRRRSV